MAGATQVGEQRRNARARLRLPVRVRWLNPLGSLTEIGETVDISRHGLLFHHWEWCPTDARVWVIVPFDPRATSPQPEIPARVVRVRDAPAGGHLVALEFELPERRGGPKPSVEHRAVPRVRCALPIRVRAGEAPWPEETMTIDVADGGVLFRSMRLYESGETLRVVFPYGRWAPAGEIAARVVRVEEVPGSAEIRVAVSLAPPAKAMPRSTTR